MGHVFAKSASLLKQIALPPDFDLPGFTLTPIELAIIDPGRQRSGSRLL
jgi:hypothetical protein